MASFLENISGTPGKVSQVNRFNSGQQGLQNQLLSQVSGMLGNQNKTKFDFSPIASEARNRFYTETVPSIAERFTAMGGSGSQSGSAFQGALGNAGANLERGLKSLETQYGLQQQGLDNQQLNSLLQMVFQSPYESIYEQGQPGFLQGAAGGLGVGLGQQLPDLLKQLAPAIGSAFGPVGTAAGVGASGLISLLQRLFSGSGSQQGNAVPSENTPGARL